MSNNEWGIVTMPTAADPEGRAIKRLQIASELTLANYGTPLVVTVSGGKDSSVCVELARRAGIPFEVLHSHTTADAPETVRFVRSEFQRLEGLGIPCSYHWPTYKGEQTSMWRLIPQKLIPPTRLVRYCCAVLKETGGTGRMIATGVRWAESNARKRRGIFEKQVSNPTKAVHTKSDTDSLEALFAPCKLAAKRIVNPIVDWSDDDVWQFCDDAKIPLNPLYREGFRRVGCVGCPMAGRFGREAEFARWPKYRQMYIAAFDRMIDARKQRGMETATWETGLDVYHWWMEDGVMPGQINLFEEG